MALRARLTNPPIPQRGEWPYHNAAVAVVNSALLRDGDRRMEAATYLSQGYGIRLSIESKEKGWGRMGSLAKVWQPPRTKATLVNSEFGEPFLAATQVFDSRPIPRKWLAASKVSHVQELFVERGQILVTRSGAVGRSTIALTPHLKTLISDDLLRIAAVDPADRGWVYAYLRAPKVRAMMTGVEYGHIIKHLEVDHLSAVPVPDIAQACRRHFTLCYEEILRMRDSAFAATIEAEDVFESIVGAVPRKTESLFFEVQAREAIFAGRRRLEALPHNPTAAGLRKHLRRRARSMTPISRLGYDLWLPGRFRRIPAEHGIAFLDSSDLFEVNPDVDKHIADGDFGDPNQGRVKPGWLLMARSGQVYGINGSVVLSNDWHANKVISDHVIRLAPRKDAVVRPGYLLVALSHPTLGRPLVKSLPYGSSIPEIEVADLQALEIARIGEEHENRIADLVEHAASLRAQADLLEIKVGLEAEMLLERFIADLDLRKYRLPGMRG